MPNDHRFLSEQFPRSSKYSPEWVVANASSGANTLWITEWLADAMDLRAGMRVLDLGCGSAMSSIFLHREFGVQVWAVDLWFNVSQNLQRIRDAGVENGVFPLHADARALPFASQFFDAIVSIDSFVYYGTDDLYLEYLARLLKPGSQIGIAGAGLMQEMDQGVPAHLQAWWEPTMCCLHSAQWWRRHWARTDIVDVELADTMPDGWQRWLDWHKTAYPDNKVEIEAIEADRGHYLGYVRTIGRRSPEAKLQDPVLSVPTQYVSKPLLRANQHFAR